LVNFVKNVRSKSLRAVVAVALLSQTAAAQERPAAAPQPQPAQPTPAAPAPSEAERAANVARDARIKALETQLSALNARLDDKPKAPPVVASPPAATKAEPRWYDRIDLSGYAQAQLEFHQDSEDQLAAGGQPLNQNRFTLRRARLKAESKLRYAEFLLELDGNTVRAPSFGVHRAEVSAVYRGADAQLTKTPLVALTAGVLVPSFGRELQEGARTRPFMERSLASRAFFPSEPDLGAKLWGSLGFFNYGVAITNGEPAGQQQGFPLRDPNSAKDVFGRLGVAAEVSSVVKAAGGVSLLNGTSTFRGTDGTKPVVSWIDANEDNQLSNVELTTTPGSSPRRSENFKHWAVGADVDVSLKTGFGISQLQAELVVASNLDRGLFVSDPITVAHDERQLGYYVAILQDVTRHAWLGFRYDYYDPRADVFGNKNGKLVPTKAAIKTFSPLLGVRLPHGLKLSGQWDLIRDRLATDLRGVPADRKNNTVTIRLQGEL
jgi:hypothetical protein